MPNQISQKDFLHWVIQEDLGNGDITTDNLIPETAHSTADIIAKSEGIISGLVFAQYLLVELSPSLHLFPKVSAGSAVNPGDLIATIEGKTRDILRIERTLLNFLKHLCGVATLTSKFVKEVQGLPVQILDTRKTTPGMRTLEKQAVLDGGGHNHRIGLYDMVLIKENHLAAHKDKPLLEIITGLKKKIPACMQIELEVDSVELLKDAVLCPVNYIMLDNFQISDVPKAVDLVKKTNPKIFTEVSGNINLQTVRKYAETGVDRISIGALTHSAPVLDLSIIIR